MRLENIGNQTEEVFDFFITNVVQGDFFFFKFAGTNRFNAQTNSYFIHNITFLNSMTQIFFMSLLPILYIKKHF